MDGATVDSGLISPVPRDTPVSSLPNVDGAAKEGSTGLLDKLKTKVGLNKKNIKRKSLIHMIVILVLIMEIHIMIKEK